MSLGDIQELGSYTDGCMYVGSTDRAWSTSGPRRRPTPGPPHALSHHAAASAS